MAIKNFPGADSFLVKRKKSKFNNFVAPIDPNNIDMLPSGGGGGVITVDPNAGGGAPVISFPDFSNMTCQQLNDEIIKMKDTVNAPSFAPKDATWVSAYQTAIKQASVLWVAKGCTLTTPAPDQNNNPTTTTNPPVNGTIPTVGGGTAPDGTKSTTTTPGTTLPTAAGTGVTAKKFPWLWIAIGAGVLLVVLGGGKSESAASN